MKFYVLPKLSFQKLLETDQHCFFTFTLKYNGSHKLARDVTNITLTGYNFN